MKWNKFDDDHPREAGRWIWASDYKTVRLWNVDPAFDHSKERMVWAYAEIEFPAPPEKETHYCTHDDGNTKWRCVQDPYDELFIEVIIPIEGNRNSSSVIFIHSCPFCGFTLEKK